MTKRYVLDGAPGSGKSTVLFGLSDGVKQGGSPYTLAGLGYACIHESVAEAHEILSGKGIDYSREKAVWLETIVELDREKYLSAKDGVIFFDRCLHHWQLLSDMSGIPLPSWYQEVAESVRYTNPVFLVAPIASMDLTAPGIHESRRFTWEQRLAMHDQAGEFYRRLGYDIVEVPVYFEGDIDQNNRERIRHILEHVE